MDKNEKNDNYNKYKKGETIKEYIKMGEEYVFKCQ